MFIKEMVVLFGKMLVFSRVMVVFLGVTPKGYARVTCGDVCVPQGFDVYLPWGDVCAS